MMVENGINWFSFVLFKERDKVESGLGFEARADVGNRSPIFVPSSPVYTPSASSQGTVMLED